MDIEKLIERLGENTDCWTDKVHGYADLRLEASTALSTLHAENESLRVLSELGNMRAKDYRVMRDRAVKAEAENEKLRAELEQVKRELDAAVEAVKNMAEYIVCAGRVDYYLCDEISQEHHLKYQPKNDGNYDNEPCYKCIADWFLQGHVWQGNCW